MAFDTWPARIGTLRKPLRVPPAFRIPKIPITTSLLDKISLTTDPRGSLNVPFKNGEKEIG